MYSLTIVITKENCKQILKFPTYDVKHFLLNSEAKKNNTLISGNAGDEKNFIREAANLFFQVIFGIFSFFFISCFAFSDS